jgi:hypothetical protein
MDKALGVRFSKPVVTTPHAIQWLSDDAPQYTAPASETQAHELGLLPIAMGAYSPESNGLAEGVVQPFNLDYVNVDELRDPGERVRPARGLDDYNLSRHKLKSADLRDRKDGPARWRLDFARMGALVVERLMRAGGVVVREVPAQQAAEVAFVDHDDVIEAFASNRADDALSEGILPGGARGNEDLAHPQSRHPPCEHIAVDRVPIAEQILGCGLFREALDQLVGSPGGGGVVGDVDMDEFSTVVRRIKNPKSKRKVSVGTTKKSTATMSWICVSRKVRHVEDGRGEGRRMYLATVSSATS